MLSSVLGNSFLVLVVLIFVAVVLLLESVYFTWRAHRGPQAMKLKSRLNALSATQDSTPQTRLLRQRMLSELPPMERLLQSLPRMRQLDRLILQSGLQWSVSSVLLSCIGLFVVGWAGVSMGLHQPQTMAVAAGVLMGSLPFVYIQYQRRKRLEKFERQLPEALDLITRALRAGHAFPAALKMAGEELSEPIAGEFSTVHDEVNFGVSLGQALGHLSERVPLTDLRYFVVAVLIQRESGGNLTEILGNLSRLIRERLKLMGKVRVLSSEGRLSAWILTLMPFFMAGLMNLMNPTFMKPLWTDPMGINIITYTLTLMFFGVLIMRKIIKIRY
jgi:tight adherence protein B